VLRALLPHPVSRTEAQPAVTKEPRDETALPKEPARSARRARRP